MSSKSSSKDAVKAASPPTPRSTALMVNMFIIIPLTITSLILSILDTLHVHTTELYTWEMLELSQLVLYSGLAAYLLVSTMKMTTLTDYVNAANNASSKYAADAKKKEAQPLKGASSLAGTSDSLQPQWRRNMIMGPALFLQAFLMMLYTIVTTANVVFLYDYCNGGASGFLSEMDQGFQLDASQPWVLEQKLFLMYDVRDRALAAVFTTVLLWFICRRVPGSQTKIRWIDY